MSASISRRALFPVAGLALVTTVAGCSALRHVFPNGNASLAQSAVDVGNIAGAFKNVVPQISAVTAIPAQTQLVVTQAIGDLQIMAANLSNAASTAVAQPIILEVETDVNAVVNTLASFKALLPKVVADALQAAAILLPVIEASVGLLGANVAVPEAETVAQARKVLRDLR